MMARRHHSQAHWQRLQYLRAVYPVRGWYHGIGRLLLGWPATEETASPWGKTKWACSVQLTGGILFMGMISKSAPLSGLYDEPALLLFCRFTHCTKLPLLPMFSSSAPCNNYPHFSRFWDQLHAPLRLGLGIEMRLWSQFHIYLTGEFSIFSATWAIGAHRNVGVTVLFSNLEMSFKGRVIRLMSRLSLQQTCSVTSFNASKDSRQQLRFKVLLARSPFWSRLAAHLNPSDFFPARGR